MDVSVSTRHTELPEALRQATVDKVGRLDRYLDGMDRAEVHFSEEQNPRIADKAVCEVTLEGHGHHVRAKVRAADGYTAVDQAVVKLEAQLARLKTKLRRRTQGQDRKADPLGGLPVADLDDRGDLLTDDGREPPRVVKSKRFAIMPMTPEDAAQRMDLLGHGFFFFTNIDTHRAAVVYRRDDGDVGLIDEAG